MQALRSGITITKMIGMSKIPKAPMAYEDTNCPCGDKKLTDTMLCPACQAHFAERRELAEYQDGNLPVEYRRNAAVILVSLARRRKLPVIEVAA